MFGRKVSIGEGEKCDVSKVSTEGISKQERAELEKKNRKLIDIFKAFDIDNSGDLSSLELANAMDAFSKMDTSADDKLSKKELDAGAKALNKMFEDKNLDITAKGLKDFLKSISNLTKSDDKSSTQQVLNEYNQQLENQKQLQQQRNIIEKLEQETAQQPAPNLEMKELKEEKPELYSYTVQEGESLTTVIKKSLKAQGIENPTKEQIEEAKEKFKENNPNAVKKNSRGYEYLLVGAKVKLEGEVGDKNNATEQIKKYEEKYSKKITSEIPTEEPDEVKKYEDFTIEIWKDDNGNKTKEVRKDGDGNIKDIFEYEYNGNNTKEIHKDADGNIKDIWEYEYDDKGNETKWVTKDGEGNIKCISEYEYDDRNNIIKRVEKDAEGNITDIYEFEYDDNGNTTKEIHKDAEGNIVDD